MPPRPTTSSTRQPPSTAPADSSRSALYIRPLELSHVEPGFAQARAGQLPAGPIKSVDQVAIVVRDLDEALRRYSENLGIAPWSVSTFSPDWIPNMTFRGREQPYSMKLALAHVGEDDV